MPMPVYRFSLQYNDSYAFREYPHITDHQRIHQELVPDLSGMTFTAQRCKACGELLDKWRDPLVSLKIKKRKYDIVITYDGITVVSERFKSVYDDAGLFGIVFQKLPSDLRFFAFSAIRSICFDAERRKTRFNKPCPLCGHFESVVGATPIYLKAGTKIEGQEVVRTDLEFGSGDEKHPLLICGDAVANSLSVAGLKGLDLLAIEDVAASVD